MVMELAREILKEIKCLSYAMKELFVANGDFKIGK